MPKLRPLCVALSLIACLGCQSSRPDGDPALLLPPLEAPGPWQEDLLAAARSYRGWTRVSDANWAPWLCIAPPPSGALLSESSDRRTHGRKLYYLYTQDSQFYSWVLPRGSQPAIGENPTESAPVGFTIVKEACEQVALNPPRDRASARAKELRALAPPGPGPGRGSARREVIT